MEKKFSYAWIILIGVSIVGFLQMGLLVNTIGLFVPYIVEDVGLTMATYNTTVLVQTLAMAVGMVIAGRVLAKGNFKAPMIISVVLQFIALFLRSQATSASLFFIAGILFGMGSAISSNAVIVLLANWFHKKMGLAAGILAAAGGIGGVIFNPMVSFTITEFGWRNAFIINGFIVLIPMVLITLLMLRFAPSGKRTAYGATQSEELSDDTKAVLEGPSFSAVSKTGSFWALALVGGFMAIGMAMQMQIAVEFNEVGYSISEIAFIMSALMVGTTFAQLLTGILLDKYNRTVVCSILISLGALGFIGIMLHINYIMTLMSAVLIGFNAAFIGVALPVLRKAAFGTKSFSQVTAISGILSLIIPGLIMVVSGVVFDIMRTFIVMFGLVAVLLITSIFMIVSTMKNSYQNTGTKLNNIYVKEKTEEEEYEREFMEEYAEYAE